MYGCVCTLAPLGALSGTRGSPLKSFTSEIAGNFQDFLNQGFHFSFGHGGVHARELQALMTADAAVTDDRLPALEKALAHRTV